MPTLDIFKGDAFSAVSMTEAVEKIPFKPNFLGSIPGLFVPRPVRTESVAVEERDGTLGVIQTSQRGAPLKQRATEKRKIRDFRTVRIAEGDRVTAAEVQNIRAFGQESELMQVQDEVTRRLSGPTGLRAKVELTHERHRLGAVQGIVLDADDTVIYNWFDEFNIAAPNAVDFVLQTATTNVRGKCTQVVRAVRRGLKMGDGIPVPVIGLAGDTFWDKLVDHDRVRDTYLNQQEAKELRKDAAFQTFDFGGITFVNYRGTDDGSTIAVPAAECKFFPAVPGAFEVAYSPAETFDFVNTPGKDVYSMIIPDKDRNSFVDIEVYSYPLFICKRPGALQKATTG